MRSSPFNKKGCKDVLRMECWEGYTAEGKKESPSGKKTAAGNIKLVNNCVKE